MEQSSVRVTAEKGEFLVLSKVPRRRGKHRWQILVQKKTPGKPMSIGIGIDIDDKELTRGAQDTLFANRIWHYCNVDGTVRNGAIQEKVKTKQAYGTGDTIDVFLDVEAGEVSFGRNDRVLDGTVVHNVVHTSFLEKQKAAKAAGEEMEEGLGRFYLVVSLSPGDQVRLEDAPCELRYTELEGRYPWWSEITPNNPVFDSGTYPMHFELSRPLPPALVMDPDTGIISGTPTGINTLNLGAWRDLCFQMYRGRIGEQGWKKARLALLKELGIGLDPDQIKARAAELFAIYDTDGSGEIDFSELKSLMESLKVILTDVELMNMAADLDVDGNAEIGLVEFEEMLVRMYNSKDKYGAWREASNALVRKLGAGLDVEMVLPRKCREIFNEYDTDGSGYIDLGELEQAMHSLGVEVDSETVVQMVDEAGIDQGEGDHIGIDFPSWLELLKGMYTGSDTSIWEVAKAGIVKMLGTNLSDDELYQRCDEVFKELDSDGSGKLDMEELGIAMKNIGVNVMSDELSRMLEECDVNGRLWTVTASNHLGECKYILKVIVVEGASELGYASTDVFCGIRLKFPPLKVAHLRGARPFKFSIEPPLPEGMNIEEETGTFTTTTTTLSTATAALITTIP
jgi:Ca2+-binding EF-hand superfamily protein